MSNKEKAYTSNTTSGPDKITAPYNFVPLNEHVYCPDWAEQVSQDIPFRDGEDGCIEVTWRNVSPLCIRDASDYDTVKTFTSNKPEDHKVYYSMNIKQPDGQRRYFIPGSSLRGMLRNTLNIMSFGKMTQYDDRYMGYRIFDTKKQGGRAYQERMQSMQFGWLEYKAGDDKPYKLYKCDGDVEKIEITDVKRTYGEQYDKYTSAWERNEVIRRNASNVDKNGYVIENDKFLFATGKIHNKKHELLIPKWKQEPSYSFTENDKVITSFFTVYNSTPNFEKYREKLENGQKIPVKIVNSDDGSIVLGMGRMIRYPYKYGVRDLVEKRQKPEKIEGLDLCETIFGMVEGHDALKGRVQVGNAFADKIIADRDLLPIVTKVLGSPKPSFYPLYIKQEAGRYNNYDNDESCISGKKLYRIHKGSSVVDSPKNNDNGEPANSKVQTSFRPLPSNNTFKMRIVVHNLKKIEIGALLSAITFHNTKDEWHNIGTAKGFGYGKIKCDEIKLCNLKLSEEEYLKAFELEMSAFVKYKYGKLWTETDETKNLLAIMSEHDDKSVRVMQMDRAKSPYGVNEFNHFSKNSNFCKLSETLKSIIPLVTTEEVLPLVKIRKKNDFKRKHKQEYAEVDSLRALQKYDEAIQLQKNIIFELQKESLSFVEENNNLENLQQELEKYKKEQEKQKERDKDKENEEFIKKGYSAHLNECVLWKACCNFNEKWLKVCGKTELDEDEKDTLENKIKWLYANQDKKEKREWAKPKDKSFIWRGINKYLGKNRTDAIYAELVIK